jgi:Raf kinase inhibitor-like YbhB/YbcL family protein
MRVVSSTCLMVQVLALIGVLSSRTNGASDPDPGLTLSSSAFQNGMAIPERYTCSGHNQSPAISWSGVPPRTASFALIVDDPDAPLSSFVHWVIYNLPANAKALPESVPTSRSAEGGEQGVNGSGEIGYMGPCPPPGKPHHYHFRLYALDRTLELEAGVTAHEVLTAIDGHVLARSELVGIFER